MIKWKFVFIRLGLLLAILAVIHFGTSPLLRFGVTTLTQWLTGSKLEIASLDASPFQTQVHVGEVKFADPSDPMKNLFDFSAAHLDFDQNALLHKKFIVTDGSLDGLQFGTQRTTSGKVERPETDPDAESSLINDYISGVGENVASGLTDLLTRRFDENFETVRYSKDVFERWPKEYAVLMQRGKNLEIRIREIRDLSKALQANPLNTLRDLPKVEQAVRDSATIKAELKKLQQSLVSHRNQILVDRNNIVAAKNRDLARINEIKNSKRLNGRSLSQLLVGDQNGQRVDLAISWIKWLRTTFPHPKKQLDANRSRGQTILFPGIKAEPDVLVRSLRLNGIGTFENRPYEFTGQIAGLTHQPERYGKPAYLHFESTGDIQFSVKGMVDRSQSIDHDRIVIKIPALDVSNQELEIDDKVQLSLSNSEVEINARIELIGNELSGQVKAVQKNVGLAIATNIQNEFAGELRTMLNEDLKAIEGFQIIAKISGTPESPKWELNSNLGPQIANAFNSTISRGYEMKKAELVGRLNRESDQALAKVSELLQSNEHVVSSFLKSQTSEIFQLENRVADLLKIGGLRFR